MKKLLMGLLITGGLFGQVVDTPQFKPAYLVGSGISYDYYGKTGFALQQTFAAQSSKVLPDSKFTENMYSYWTLTNTQSQSAISTGIIYNVMQNGNWSLGLMGTAGLLSGSNAPILSQFTGGGVMMYDIGARLKSSHHYYVVGGVSILGVTSQVVKPIYGIGFAAGF
jgi:hypothetical protein